MGPEQHTGGSGRHGDTAGRLARRTALNPQSPLPGSESVINVTAEELAPRLGLTRFAARRYVENARLFRLKLEDTGEALRTGHIDFAKACVLARLLKDQPDDAAGLDLALEAAARTAKASGDTRTLDQLRADALALLGHRALERGFIGASAADAAELAEDGRAGAGVTQPAVPRAPDTTAEVGPANDAEAASSDSSPEMETGNSFLRMLHMPIGTIGGYRARIHVTVPLSVLLPPEALSHGPHPGDSSATATATGPDEPDDDGPPDDPRAVVPARPHRGVA